MPNTVGKNNKAIVGKHSIIPYISFLIASADFLCMENQPAQKSVSLWVFIYCGIPFFFFSDYSERENSIKTQVDFKRIGFLLLN